MDLSDIILDTKLNSTFPSIRSSAVDNLLQVPTDNLKKSVSKLVRQISTLRKDESWKSQMNALECLLQLIQFSKGINQINLVMSEVKQVLFSAVGSQSATNETTHDILLVLAELYWSASSLSDKSTSIAEPENPLLSLYQSIPRFLPKIIDCIVNCTERLHEKAYQRKWISSHIKLYLSVYSYRNAGAGDVQFRLTCLLKDWMGASLLDTGVLDMIHVVLKTCKLEHHCIMSLIDILLSIASDSNGTFVSDRGSLDLLLISVAVNAVMGDNQPLPWHTTRQIFSRALAYIKTPASRSIALFALSTIAVRGQSSSFRDGFYVRSSVLRFICEEVLLGEISVSTIGVPSTVLRVLGYLVVDAVERNSDLDIADKLLLLLSSSNSMHNEQENIMEVREFCVETALSFSGPFATMLIVLGDLLDGRFNSACTFAYPLLYTNLLLRKEDTIIAGADDTLTLNGLIRRCPTQSLFSCLHVLEYVLSSCLPKHAETLSRLYRDHLPVYVSFDDPFLTRKVLHLISRAMTSGTVMNSTPLEKLGLQTLFNVWRVQPRVWSRVARFLKVWMHRVNAYPRGGVKLTREQESFNVETDTVVLKFLRVVIKRQETTLWKDIVPVVATVVFGGCVSPRVMNEALKCLNELVALRVVSIESVWSQGLRRFADTYKSLTIALQKQMLRFYGFVGAYLGESEADQPFVKDILEQRLLPCLQSASPAVRSAAYKALAFFPREILDLSSIIPATFCVAAEDEPRPPVTLPDLCHALLNTKFHGAYTLLGTWMRVELEAMPRPVVKGLASGSGVSRSTWMESVTQGIQNDTAKTKEEQLVNFALDVVKHRDNLRVSAAMREAYSIFLMNQSYLYYSHTHSSYADAMKHLLSFLEYVIKEVKLSVSVFQTLDIFESLKTFWTGFIQTFEGGIASDPDFLSICETVISDVYQAAVDPSVQQMCIFARTTLLLSAVELSVHDVMNHIQTDLKSLMQGLLGGRGVAYSSRSINEMVHAASAFCATLLMHAMKESTTEDGGQSITNAFYAIQESLFKCDFKDNQMLLYLSMFLLFEIHFMVPSATSSILSEALFQSPKDATFYTSLYLADRYLLPDTIRKIGRFEDEDTEHVLSTLGDVKPEQLTIVLVKVFFVSTNASFSDRVEETRHILHKLVVLCLEKGPYEKLCLIAFSIYHSWLERYGTIQMVHLQLQKVIEIASETTIPASRRAEILQSGQCLFGSSFADKLAQSDESDSESLLNTAFSMAQMIQSVNDTNVLKGALGYFNRILSHVTGNVALISSSDRDPKDLRRLSPDTSVIRIVWDTLSDRLASNTDESLYAMDAFLTCIDELPSALTFPRVDFTHILESCKHISIQVKDSSYLERLFLFSSRQICLPLSRNTSLLNFYVVEMSAALANHEDSARVPYWTCASPEGVGILPSLIQSGTTITTAQALAIVRSLLSQWKNSTYHISILTNLLNAMDAVIEMSGNLPQDFTHGLHKVIHEYVASLDAEIQTYEEQRILALAAKLLKSSRSITLQNMRIESERDVWFYLMYLFESSDTIPPASSVLGEFIDKCLDWAESESPAGNRLVQLGSALSFTVLEFHGRMSITDRWRILIMLLDFTVLHDEMTQSLWLYLISPVLNALFGTKTSVTQDRLGVAEPPQDPYGPFVAGVNALIEAVQDLEASSEVTSQLSKRVSHLLSTLRESSSSSLGWKFTVMSLDSIQAASRA